MKAFYVILLALLLAGSVSGQSPKPHSLIQVYDSIYYWKWDTISSGWKINHKIADMVYDDNNNLLNETWQNWNGSEWENDLLNTYTYDTNNFKVSEVFKYWSSDGILTYSDSIHYYFQTVFGMEDLILTSESIKIFPNPTSSTITIKLSNNSVIKNAFLTIFNINGQQVMSRRVSQQQTVIDISALPQGIYVIKVADDRTVQVGDVAVTRKLVVMR